MNETPEHENIPTILVIDDDAQMRTTLTAMLDEEGYDVLTADNGNRALTLLKEVPVDLVITDILMPEKGGVETIIELTQAYPALPIIAMSGGGRTGNMDFLDIVTKVGTKATLTKPIDLDTLLDTVARVLSAASGGEA